MSARKLSLAAAIAAIACLLLATAAAAAPRPSWSIQSVAVPSHFPPGGSGETFYEVIATDDGGAGTSGAPITLTDALPAGLTVERVALQVRSTDAEGLIDVGPTACTVDETGAAPQVECTLTEALPETIEPVGVPPGGDLRLLVFVAVPGATEGSLTNSASVAGGGALPATIEARNEAAAAPAGPGLSYFTSSLTDEAGEPVSQAGAHPFQYTTSFAVDTEYGPPGGAPFVPAGGDIKDVDVALPPGLVGNPTATSLCSAKLFNEFRTITLANGDNYLPNDCPAGSVVGFIHITQLEGVSEELYQPIYNLVPPVGMPAQLGFQVVGMPFFIDTKVRTGSDYGITAFLSNLAEVKRVTAASVVIWGIPAESIHDKFRGECLVDVPSGPIGLSRGSCAAGQSPVPFLRTPTSCAGPADTLFDFETWTNLAPSPAPAAGTTPIGCGALDFSPTIGAVPTTTTADSASGLGFKLSLPQSQSPQGRGEADLRDATVTLPEGVTINPASANGLQGCTPAQIGMQSAPGATPVQFGEAPAQCPDAAQIGSVEVRTPLLDHPIDGGIYVASQGQNPFGSLLAIYIAAYDPLSGVVLKLPGHIEPDPTSGRVVARFTENPQLPFEGLNAEFFAGPRAPLRTPSLCGTYTTTTDLRPWSAPQSGPDRTPSDSFRVTVAPGGGACAAGAARLPNAPALQAGTESPLAGSYAPFVFRLRREDGSQQFSRLSATLPEGLLGKLAGIPYCPQSGIDQAASRSAEGAGAKEISDPSCPAASQIGDVTVTAGAGTQPLSVGGKAYLAGPYKGAPLSLEVITPAVAGPFDLGVVAVRVAVEVEPFSTQITATSDPLPTILDGIPLDLRSISLDTNRADFVLNPTDCKAMQVTAAETSVFGSVAPLAERFQVGGCGGLGFQPRLSLRVKGSTRRGGHPALRATLRMPGGSSANIARAQVGLPHSEFLDQGNLNKVCTRPQLASRSCPKRSIYGHAEAWSSLLSKPLKGPVYLGVGFGYKLPALVAELNGQIRVLLKGKVDTDRQKGIRNTFELVPDAPVSRFVLELKGGPKYGLLENSEDICGKAQHATARFTGQNGKVDAFRPRIAATCAPGKRRRAHAS
jgi:hypothetical protein